MSLPRRVRFAVLTRDRFTCRYCGRSAPAVVLHVDHIHPASRGGSDDESNLVAACADCNGSKGAKLLPIGAPPVPVATAETRKSALIGQCVLAPQPIRKSCTRCGAPESEWWRGEIVEEPVAGTFLVDWQSWLDGSPTRLQLVSHSVMIAEKWAFFSDRERFYAACRWILTEHDHDGRYRWANSGENEPPRLRIAHPGIANRRRAAWEIHLERAVGPRATS